MRVTESSAVRQGEKTFNGALFQDYQARQGYRAIMQWRKKGMRSPSVCHADVCSWLEGRSPEQGAIGQWLGLCNMA